MEYHRAYWDEQSDGYLVERHEREIFPLLRQRHLFAEAENFRLYDFFSGEGYVNEDVLAYSNRSGFERALVVYHNRFATAHGWIRTSTGFPVRIGDDERQLQINNLAEGLDLANDAGTYTIFRDHRIGLEYIRSNQELWEKGLYLELDAYQYHVFQNFRQVQNQPLLPYSQCCDYLGGRGVPSIEEAIQEILLQPIHTPYRELVNAGQMRWLIDNRLTDVASKKASTELLAEVEMKALALLEEIKGQTAGSGDAAEIAGKMRRDTGIALSLPLLESSRIPAGERKAKDALKFMLSGVGKKSRIGEGDPFAWGTLLSWIFTKHLGAVVSAQNPGEISRAWIEEWLLAKIISAGLVELGLTPEQAGKSLMLIRLMSGHADWFERFSQEDNPGAAVLQSWLIDPELQRFLQVNRYQEILWFNRDAFEELLWWLCLGSLFSSPQEITDALVSRLGIVERLLDAARDSGYQVEKLVAAVKQAG
jgi:hypothetical protein